MTALARPDDMAALEALNPAARELAVTQYLTDARDRLASALEATGPASVAALKAEIATAAEATKQLGLSREIQIDALEMVRRAEFALGKAVKAGQVAGEIKTLADGGPRSDYERGGHIVHVTQDPSRDTTGKSSPNDFFKNTDEKVDAYAMAGASAAEFDAALSDARSEGNLSRANVIRKLEGVKTDGLTPVEKLRKIRELADTGRTSAQIAHEIGGSEDYVRRIAKANSILIQADNVVRGLGKLRVDSNHIVNHAVITLEALTGDGLNLIRFDDLDATQTENWVASLGSSISRLKRLQNDIKRSATQ